MADDVNAAILRVLRSEGALSEDAASRRLTELRSERRYQRDVY